MAKPKKRKRARELRQPGWSLRAIEQELGVSRSSVSRWTQNIELSPEQEENLRENVRLKVLQKGTIKNSEIHLSLRRSYQQQGRQHALLMRPLHLIGCMLYWAEGSKDRNRLEFVNSDTNMIHLFGRFLRQELNVPSDDIVIRITCHTKELNVIEIIENYWLDLLDLPESSLRKTQYKQGTETRKNRLPFGVCSIRVDKTELVQYIFGAIQEYGDFVNEDWLY